MPTSIQQAAYNHHFPGHLDERARELQASLWEDRYKLWKGSVPAHKIEALEPSVALESLGYSVECVDSLGNFPGTRSEAAGEIDNRTKIVKVSRRFLLPEQRFTLAHELGHAVLHPNLGRMHRDLPLDHAGVSRSPQEVEANRFASCFLMPENHVRAYFGRRFLSEQLDLEDEAVAFALCGVSSDTLRLRHKGSRALSRCVASAEGFNGHRFVSLSSLFRVSVTAMAIRLEELGLIKH